MQRIILMHFGTALQISRRMLITEILIYQSLQMILLEILRPSLSDSSSTTNDPRSTLLCQTARMDCKTFTITPSSTLTFESRTEISPPQITPSQIVRLDSYKIIRTQAFSLRHLTGQHLS